MTEEKNQDIDLTKDFNMSKERPKKKHPNFIFKDKGKLIASKSKPLLKVEKEINSHEAKKLVHSCLDVGLKSLNEIFRNSPSQLKTVKLFNDISTGAKLSQPVIMDVNKAKSNIALKLNGLLSEMEQNYKTYDAWTEEVEDVEMEYTHPVIVRFYLTCPETYVFSDIFILFDMNVQLLHLAEITRQISERERQDEIIKMKNEITGFVRYVNQMSLAFYNSKNFVLGLGKKGDYRKKKNEKN